MSTPAVRRGLGEILAHGEPETGMGQGEAADGAVQPSSEQPPTAAPPDGGNGSGELVAVDFSALGPAGPEAA